MHIGKVTGNVWSTKKSEKLNGLKFMLVENLNDNNISFVAVDSVGAGIGDKVLVTFGNSGRIAIDKNIPVDAVIVGVIE